jgi:hypothetical protein
LKDLGIGHQKEFVKLNMLGQYVSIIHRINDMSVEDLRENRISNTSEANLNKKMQRLLNTEMEIRFINFEENVAEMMEEGNSID